MNAQQEKEVKIVKDFFNTLGTSVSIQTSDKPDVIVKFLDDARLIGIEVTEYFVDKNPKHNSSPGQCLLGYWSKVQKQINSYRSEYPKLSEIYAYVILRKEKFKKKKPNIQKFANEIVSVVRANSQEAVSDIIIITNWEERHISDFTGYPLLNNYVKQVDIRKGILFSTWDANVRATHIGVNYAQLAKIIKQKSDKAEHYDKDHLNELWLLIAAPHDSVFNAMHAFPDQINFSNQTVIKTCKSTKFHQIHFWSSPPHKWTRQIWPKLED